MSERKEIWTGERKNIDFHIDYMIPITSIFDVAAYDYLHGIITDGQENQAQRERMFRNDMAKYAKLKSLAAELDRSLNENNRKNVMDLTSLRKQIENINDETYEAEGTDVPMDSHSKQILMRFFGVLGFDTRGAEI